MYTSGTANSMPLTATGYASIKDEPDSGSPIRDSVSNAEQMLSEIHGTIDQLEKRLETMLVPIPPQPATTTSQPIPQPVTSHVRGRLIILNEGYMHAVRRLHELIRRVEL